MKVAVVLTGHMRCYKQIHKNFKEAIIDRFNPDIFIHTWEEEGWWDPHSEEGFVENSSKLDMEKIKELYNPKSIVIEEFQNLKESFINRASVFKNFFHVPKNTISMYYKIAKGVQELENYCLSTGTTYDLVIRMRPDLLFLQHLPEFNPDIFYTVFHRNHIDLGTGDCIQVSNMYDIIKFSKLLLSINNIYEQTKLFCPHVILEQFIKNENFKWHEIDLSYVVFHTPKGPYVKKEEYLNSIKY